MAENESLDLNNHYSQRWQKWIDDWVGGKSPDDLAKSAQRKLIKTIRSLKRGFICMNGVPLSAVLDAATGAGGDVAAIVRNARYGREYLQLVQLLSGQGYSRQEVLTHWMSSVIERVCDQGEAKNAHIGWERSSALVGVKELLIAPIDQLAERLAQAPDAPLRQVGRTKNQHENDEIQQLTMSVAAPQVRSHVGKVSEVVVIEF